MRALVRAGFAGLMLLGVAIRLGQAPRTEPDPVDELAAGFQALGLAAAPTPASGVVAGRSPTCPRAVFGSLVPIDGSQDEVMRDVSVPGATARYVYLGAVTAAADRGGLLWRWAWSMLAYDFGLRAHRPSFRMALVVLPPGCPALDALAWVALSPSDDAPTPAASLR